jgi:hypothetical protein
LKQNYYMKIIHAFKNMLTLNAENMQSSMKIITLQ